MDTRPCKCSMKYLLPSCKKPKPLNNYLILGEGNSLESMRKFSLTNPIVGATKLSKPSLTSHPVLFVLKMKQTFSIRSSSSDERQENIIAQFSVRQYSFANSFYRLKYVPMPYSPSIPTIKLLIIR